MSAEPGSSRPAAASSLVSAAIEYSARNTVSYDAADYKNRNVIERAFNVVKNWRGLASRYDKHAVVYRGGLVLAAILTWLR